jgi:hypothetical protein
MRATFQANLEKAKKAVENAKGAMTAAASQMFAFYPNLLSAKNKYLWNKIVFKQTGSNPYGDLQGVSQTSPRGMSCKLFNDCVLFHLLTKLAINAAEQEKYYITNVLNRMTLIRVWAGTKNSCSIAFLW